MGDEGKAYVVRGRHAPQKRALAYELRRSMTPAVRVLWNAVRANRCGGLHIRRQQIIHGFIADFSCHAKGLVIEVDGGIHDRQREEDTLRTEAFAKRDLRVLRFSNERVRSNLRSCLAAIQEFDNSQNIRNESPPPRGEGVGGWVP